MAFAVRETAIANPASRGSGKKRVKKVAAKRRLSAKQIKAGFGGKRRKTAAKHPRRHAARTRPAKRRMNAAPKVRRASPRRKPARKRNLGEIVSILLPGVAGNPAKRKGRKTMAATKRRKKRATGQRNAGSRRRTMKVVRHHRRRSNPGMGKTGEFIKLGASVVGGAVGSKYITQLVLNTKNTSWMGYLGNLIATAVLGYGASQFFRDKIVAQGIVGGGIAQVIVRVIGDQTPYGSYLQGAGVGDYQASAFLAPQRMVDARHTAQVELPNWALTPPAAVAVTHSASAAGVGGWSPDWN